MTLAAVGTAVLLLALCLVLSWPLGSLNAAADSGAPARDLDRLLGVAPTAEANHDATGRYFWVQAADGSDGYVRKRFSLAGSTQVFRVWAEDSTEVDPDLMVGVARDLEARLGRGVLGTLWRATKARGIDAAPVDLVFAAFRGAGGYFTSADQPGSYSHPHSNRTNVIYVSEADCQLGVMCGLGLPAHELQHLLQYLIDPQEQAWMTEGLSEVAEADVGAGADGGVQLGCTDFPLLRWTDDERSVGLYYAGAGDFLRFWERFYGRSALGAVAVSPIRGTAAFDTYLGVHGLEGDFDTAFMEWAAEQASTSLAEHPPGERLYPTHGICSSTSLLTLTPNGEVQDTVSPYGCDRIVIDGSDAVTLTFAGEAAASAVPVEPHTGTSLWWSGRANQSQTTLTRELDLTEVQAAHLSFWLWYDLEEFYDWGYVAVSENGGATWQVLGSGDSTAENPVGNSPGLGYTGDSGGWSRQTVDLSAYAGNRVLLQFGYLTDDAVEYPGLAVDDLSLPEIGLEDQMETAGAWTARGFRLESTLRPLAQLYGARLVTVGSEGYTSRPLSVDASGRAAWELPAAEPGEERAIVICGLTEAAAGPATYRVVAAAN